MLIIVLLAAKSTWAKNLNSPYWAPAIITIGIIFFITYFIFTVRALFYRQHGYDNQYIYYYKSTSYFNILKLIINTLFNKEMYQDKIAFKDIKNVKLDGIIKHLEYTHLEVKSLIQFILRLMNRWLLKRI